VDFSRNWMHTDLLNAFCSSRIVSPILQYPCSTVDFTYNFNMNLFSIIDHFILSDHLFNQSINQSINQNLFSK